MQPTEIKQAPYQLIVIDPPWPERGGGKVKRGADAHYEVMSIPDIIRTILSATWPYDPELDGLHAEQYSAVYHPDKQGTHVWLWVTANYLASGIDVMRAIGARYITNRIWVKAEEEQAIICPRGIRPKNLESAEMRTVIKKETFGIGQYRRGEDEMVLLGTIGTRASRCKSIGSVFAAPTTVHSAKPDIFFEQARQIAGEDARCLDMFGRKPRPGWSVWGDECMDRQP